MVNTLNCTHKIKIDPLHSSTCSPPQLRLALSAMFVFVQLGRTGQPDLHQVANSNIWKFNTETQSVLLQWGLLSSFVDRSVFASVFTRSTSRQNCMQMFFQCNVLEVKDLQKVDHGFSECFEVTQNTELSKHLSLFKQHHHSKAADFMCNSLKVIFRFQTLWVNTHRTFQ